MMPAAKHGDPQMGVDIHLCVVPPSPSPVPLPTPHISIVFDPFDYVPHLGATVTVCGMRRAVAGTAGKAVHIPPGFPFAPKIPDTSDELFMRTCCLIQKCSRDAGSCRSQMHPGFIARLPLPNHPVSQMMLVRTCRSARWPTRPSELAGR